MCHSSRNVRGVEHAEAAFAEQPAPPRRILFRNFIFRNVFGLRLTKGSQIQKTFGIAENFYLADALNLNVTNT